MSPAGRALLTSWSIPPWTTFLVLLTAIVYARGWRRLDRLRSTLFPPWRFWCFFSGLASFWVAIASPLNSFDAFLLTAHMVQHLLLILVAPPLILLGFPTVPLLRGLPRWAARDMLGPYLGWPTLGRLGRALTHPAFCWFIAAIALLGWHVPAAYDLALRSPGWHEFEHACFLGSSLLFWWPVIQPWPSVSPWPRWTVPIYLLLGAIVNTALAAFVCFCGRLLYPAYAGVPRLFGLSAMNDQVAAGALMWAFGSFVFLAVGAVATFKLLSPATANLEPAPQDLLQAAVESRPVSRPFDLLRVPLVGALLRARYGRRILQGLLLLVAVAVVADGFFGTSMAPMNLGGVVPWTYARALAVIALLAAGNFFCMACPFTVPREFGRRLGAATHNWPHWLRTKWLATALLVVFFWAYEAFRLWNSPLATAWIVVAYFVGALVTDAFFRGASFCKYVCPIGQFGFVSSLVSPLQVSVREREVCTRCTSHDCLRGNERQRGCELHLYLPQKSGSMDCTFCLDCVKACPHDNIGILALSPAHDLLRDPKRSSVGRLSERPDIAAVALVMVFAGFAGGAAMVAPFTRWQEVLVERFRLSSPLPFLTFYFLIALVVAPLFLIVGSATAGRFLAGTELSMSEIREIFCRQSVSLIPLGLAIWVSHLLFHLSTGWKTIWPVLQQAAADCGVPRLGLPHWSMPNPMLSSGTLLNAQMLVLDAGLIFTLYVGWRAAQDLVSSAWPALRSIAPWVLVAVGLYAAGVWTLLQPMQMFGMIQ
jgi:cytochrome c oxidase assembly factor CtaG/ferredoxin